MNAWDPKADHFTLVAGLSSSGKSTWLSRNVAKEKIIFPFKLGNDFSKLPETSFIHYNTLRYADNHACNLARDFTHDPFLGEILRHAGSFDLIYIAATPEELLRRIDVRHTIEDGEGVYPKNPIATAIRDIDHRMFHAAWLDLLVPVSRHAQVILSDATGFHDVSRSDLVGAMPTI